jgi:hypothetical protein
MLVEIRKPPSGPWPAMWPRLMEGLGLYTTHRYASSLTKLEIMNCELAKYDGRLVSVDHNVVILEFDHAHDWVQFELAWS